MNVTDAEYDAAQRLADQAQDQVDGQARMILRMRASGVPTATAEAALRTMTIIKDQMLARLKGMQRPLRIVPASN